ncbi:transglycosylase [Citrus sinensis]|uniref:Transglycosylase n=1 Tax=Citrus sinensis TaxID=2711 RepID=A0ACB8HQE0_CITSI|nr:transglycosylase [Citrus sinensis]
MANKISGQGTTRCTETPRPPGRSCITKILAEFADIPVSGVARHVSHSNAAIPIGLSPCLFLLSVWLQFLISFSIPPHNNKLRTERDIHSHSHSPFPLSSDLHAIRSDQEQFARMVVSFKYWDDCIEAEDLKEMWKEVEVSTEWIDAGEDRGQKVHLSRDPDGQPYLTQTEMRAVAYIVVRRHFRSQIDPDMICAIAELESDRQLLAVRYDKKSKEAKVGLMQITHKNAVWLFSEMGYRLYDVEQNPDLLFRPLVSIYFGAAYLKWLSTFQDKKFFDDGPSPANASGAPPPVHAGASESSGTEYWDSITTPEDMEQMWAHPDVVKEWTRSGEKRGKVRFSHDAKKRSYLSRVELKAVAEIILSKYFSTKGVKPTYLCAIAEMVSMRFVNGVSPRIGLMGIDYSTAFWIYMELGYRAYKVDSADDLTKPFVSMYFGAAYLSYLSEYEGKERTPQFVVQAYLEGPKNVNLQETGPSWLKFEQALGNYEATKRIYYYYKRLMKCVNAFLTRMRDGVSRQLGKDFGILPEFW